MAFDPVRGTIVLWGGADEAVWEWDGTDWSMRRPTSGPGPRQGAAIAFDVRSRQIVLIGGANSGGTLGDTWHLRGNRWRLQHPTTSPTARLSPAMVSDPSGGVLLFGGSSGAGFQAETWTYSSGRWQLHALATAPQARRLHALAPDPAGRGVLLFGGESDSGPRDDSWIWRGRTWVAANTTSRPPARSGHAMAFDPTRRRVVLFGGWNQTALADTWEWDGRDWQRSTPPASPTARAWHVMAFDASRNRVLLFGGWDGAACGDTWEWDGITWTRLTAPTSPPPRWLAAITCDDQRRRVVLHGGRSDTVRLHDTWEWDGIRWELQRPTADSRARHAVAFDRSRGQVVMFGGEADAPGALWLYGSPAAASAEAYGFACAGTSGPAVLTSRLPYLGSSNFRFELGTARAQSLCMFGLATAPDSLPVGSGCSLYVKPPIVPLLAVTNPHGFAQSAILPIPYAPQLRGARLYAQAFTLDPAVPVLGIGFSNGIAARLGD